MVLLDILFPRHCLGCSKLGSYICLDCGKQLKYIEKDICIYCRRPSLYGLTHPRCKQRLGLDGVISLFYYNNFLKKVIKAIKYRLASTVWDDFQREIAPQSIARVLIYTSFIDNIVLCPIPLHPYRLKERGFNQAEIISNWLSTYLQTPVAHLLLRTIHTPPQAKIHDSQQRHKNVHNIFTMKDGSVLFPGVILIDDVITTGSTILEATHILKEAGVSKVYTITIARG